MARQNLEKLNTTDLGASVSNTLGYRDGLIEGMALAHGLQVTKVEPRDWYEVMFEEPPTELTVVEKSMELMTKKYPKYLAELTRKGRKEQSYLYDLINAFLLAKYGEKMEKEKLRSNNEYLQQN